MPEASALDGLIWADHVLLGRAVINVVDNALRHNPPPTSVTVAAKLEGEQLVVSAMDDGKGLPPKVLAAIEGAVSHGELPVDIGTGIATVYGLVSAQGGTVTYSSGPEGTCCKISLPRDATMDRDR